MRGGGGIADGRGESVRMVKRVQRDCRRGGYRDNFLLINLGKILT